MLETNTTITVFITTEHLKNYADDATMQTKRNYALSNAKYNTISNQLGIRNLSTLLTDTLI